MPRRWLLHRPSTLVGNSGIRSRRSRRISWIRPLWPPGVASTFRLARRGRCEPPGPHRGVILGAVSGTRFEGRKASERGSRAAPGGSGLVRSRREADRPVSYQFLRALSCARLGGGGECAARLRRRVRGTAGAPWPPSPAQYSSDCYEPPASCGTSGRDPGSNRPLPIDPRTKGHTHRRFNGWSHR
jgi:hypothetical protein